MNYDSKNYEFATTASPVPGPVAPPEGERWTFVSMSIREAAPILTVVVWTREKKKL